MSGGSMDYICYKLSDAAGHIKDKEIKDLTNDLSNLLHDLEWWESGDYSRGSYEETLSKFKQKWFKGSRKDRLKGYIDEQLADVKAEMYSLIGVNDE